MSITKDNKPNNGYSRISIGLASPEEILAQSSGEVLKPETINYRTYKPERDGLFCERIFGPVKDYECHCGKYKRIRYKGIVCDRCGVEVTEKKVRRERMGHISLVVPVVHIWYFRSLPSKIGYLLGIPSKKLEAIIYYERYVVINAGAASEQGIERLATLSEKEYLDVLAALPKGNQSLDDSDPNKFVAMMGAEAIYTLLKQVDLDSMSYALRHKASTETSQQRKSRGAEVPERHRVVPRFGGQEQARVDGAERDSGDSARAAPAGAAGRRTFRHVGPERPLPPRHHPQQPPQTPDRDQGSGGDSAQREAHVAGGRRLAVRQLAQEQRREERVEPSAQVAVGFAQGQAGPFPPEPAG